MATSKQLPDGRPAVSRNQGKRLRKSSKKPNHVDQHVGTRLRLRRNLLDLSQDDLARRLGVTAQLIQKYEAGETRISASRLYEIANQLAVPITWFFDEIDVEAGAAVPEAAHEQTADFSELVTKRESRQLLELYFGISDERLRRKVLQMAELLRSRDDE
ncbi:MULTISPECIES: helix-turn-helix domain-containing protein [unclassified Bradyrhizobium]|uniref:helix-turn-helix domain-containing protein n=1 Tax=unclassified Bradyrhizobium TaxID=2631580 RepID=UPI002916C874|nr:MULTISPECIES: helix-turn-helix domain-containing protein [unclassified Bradyrhizobium]